MAAESVLQGAGADRHPAHPDGDEFDRQALHRLRRLPPYGKDKIIDGVGELLEPAHGQPVHVRTPSRGSPGRGAIST